MSQRLADANRASAQLFTSSPANKVQSDTKRDQLDAHVLLDPSQRSLELPQVGWGHWPLLSCFTLTKWGCRRDRHQPESLRGGFNQGPRQNVADATDPGHASGGRNCTTLEGSLRNKVNEENILH